jgi:S1-C subfamily serine protease
LSGSRFRSDELWVFPDPERIGITLDRQRQALVTAVAAGSPAVASGLRAGDELLSLGEQSSVKTLSDVQWALHRAPFAAIDLPVRYRRDGDEHAATLVLADGWKRCPPEHYAWRPYKWTLSPAPGFGGPMLEGAQKRALGLDGDAFAFQVQYIVDWGERAHRGRAVRAAGLRKGDVVVSFAGKHDFVSVEHFHAWVRLTRTAGEEVEIAVLRDGERHVLRYALPE